MIITEWKIFFIVYFLLPCNNFSCRTLLLLSSILIENCTVKDFISSCLSCGSRFLFWTRRTFGTWSWGWSRSRSTSWAWSRSWPGSGFRSWPSCSRRSRTRSWTLSWSWSRTWSGSSGAARRGRIGSWTVLSFFIAAPSFRQLLFFLFGTTFFVLFFFHWRFKIPFAVTLHFELLLIQRPVSNDQFWIGCLKIKKNSWKFFGQNKHCNLTIFLPVPKSSKRRWKRTRESLNGVRHVGIIF